MRRFAVLWAFLFILWNAGCAGLTDWLPDSYSSPDGKYKQNCEPKDLKTCTQTCDIEVDGHKSKKAIPLDPKECQKES